MSVNTFQDLKVWQKAHQFVLDIFNLTKSFPEHERFILVSQFRRSVLSIAANIAEGSKKTQKDFIRFLDISRGSLEETRYYIILSRDLGYCPKVHFEDLNLKADELGKMLYALKNKINQDLLLTADS